MRASLIRKIWILLKAVATTLGISLYVLYMRLTRTYDRQYADRILRWWSQGLLDVVGATYEISDPCGVTIEPGTPYIIMSNHRSLYDVPLIYRSIPGSIRMLTKKELFKVPLWGQGLAAAEFLSIDRNNHDQALRDMDAARVKMMTGLAVWIAPEGTRSRSGRLGKFKKGGFMLALQTGATIIPVGIQGSERILRPESHDVSLGQHVKVRIGQPVRADDYILKSRDELMQDVRSKILELAGEEEPA